MIRRLAYAASLCAAAAGLAIGASAQSPSDPYTIKPLRWDEDYAQFAPPADAGFPRTWKRVGLGAGYVSFGGEARVRVEHLEAPLFGMRPIDDYTGVAGRLLLHGDWHPSPQARVFAQLNLSDERGRQPRERPADETAVELAQGFLDWTVDGWRLRAGRQELAFGRYITTRDGTNLRRTFDGVRATGPLAGGSLDAFAAHLTLQKKGAFDDRPDTDDRAWGAIYGHPVGKAARFLVTYFGRANDRANFASGAGLETRHAVALRLQATRGPWDFDGQVSRQFGVLESAGRDLDIRAFGMATETGFTFAKAPWRPRAAIRLDAAGGDKDARDGVLGTFELSYPNLTYISDAAAFAPRNLIGVQPFLTVRPNAQLSVTVGEDLLWRMFRGDALYAPAATIIAPAGGDGGLVAAQTYARVTASPNRHMELTASLVHIHAGDAIVAAGGRDQIFAGGHIALRF